MAPYYIELGLVAWSLVVLMGGAFLPRLPRRVTAVSTIAVLLGLTIASLMTPVEVIPGVQYMQEYLGRLYIYDTMSYVVKPLFLLAALFAVAASYEYRNQLPCGFQELVFLLLTATTGMCLLMSTREFMTFFVSLELVTISFYVMVSFLRGSPRSLEAGVKYLVIGGLTTGFLVLGIGLYYGCTGGTRMLPIAQVPILAVLALLFLLFGLLFKVGAFPVHIWVPDTYQGAPTPVTFLLATASKAAGVLVLMRVLFLVFPEQQVRLLWVISLLVLGVFSLLYGNLAAIPQVNVKRMLAYSGIGHSGFLLLALATAGMGRFSEFVTDGPDAVVFYLLAYLLASAVCFLVITCVSNVSRSDNMSDFSGLARRSPGLAFAMLVGLVSLAGIPPLMGFFGKFLVFAAVIEVALYRPILWLAVLAAIFATIAGLYYYLGLVKAMYFGRWEDERPVHVSPLAKAVLILSTTGLIVLGIAPGPLMAFIREGMSQFVTTVF